MNSRYLTDSILTRAKEIQAWIAEKSCSTGVSVLDRAFWERSVSDSDRKELLSRAEKRLNEPFPEITEEIYFEREYRKKNYQADKILFSSMRYLEQTVLAECVENEGRFLAYIERGVHSICGRKSLVRPGHDAAFGYIDYRGIHGLIDLYASSVAWRLSVIDACIGDHLTAETRALMKRTIKTKVLDVFWQRLEENPDLIVFENKTPLYWLDGFDNWLAVCLSGVVCAGIYYESLEKKAILISLYESMIQKYLASLPEGYCVEGLAYWGYGFSKFIAASDLLFRLTDGKIDLYGQHDFYEAARFGERICLSKGVYPSVADCAFGTVPAPLCLTYLGLRDGSLAVENMPPVDLSLDIYQVMLFWNWDGRLTDTLPHAASDRLRSAFEHQGVFIFRDPEMDMGVYVQAGHNHGPHNHNDIGAFILSAAEDTFVVDPGFSLYNEKTFSHDRYTLEVLSSLGHSVPKVDGLLQGPAFLTDYNENSAVRKEGSAYGSIQYYGVVTDTHYSDDADSVTIDLTHAYDEGKLLSLKETVTLDRLRKTVDVQYLYEVKEPCAFEAAIITYFPALVKQNGGIILQGAHHDLAVRFDSEQAEVSFSCIQDAVKGDHDIPAYPLRIAFPTVLQKKGAFRLRFFIQPA